MDFVLRIAPLLLALAAGTSTLVASYCGVRVDYGERTAFVLRSI